MINAEKKIYYKKIICIHVLLGTKHKQSHDDAANVRYPQPVYQLKELCDKDKIMVDTILLTKAINYNTN